MAWLFWAFITILVFVITVGLVVIFRMRKKHRQMMADIGKKLEYYEKNGFVKKDWKSIICTTVSRWLSLLQRK